MRRIWIHLPILFLLLVGTPVLSAQQELYPKKEGIQQPLHWSALPNWMTLDMELRGRTEEQTSLGYVSGKDRLYELTRVWGGVKLHPADWFTGYLQFMDLHALGLPVRDVASNMRDTFDFRQAYIQTGPKFVQFKVGRQELKYGDERVVGISDWTNVSRTFDAALLRIGNDKNYVDLFTSAVVVIAPTSLDKHGAGLTFHGAEGKFTTLIPKTTFGPFVLVHATRGVTSNQGLKGNKIATTFGAYYDTKLPLGFDSSGTGDLQRGSYSNDSIQAGAAIFRGGWAIYKAPWQLHLGGEYDYATGNLLRNPNQYGTYDQQYPSNHDAFGLVDLFGFQNIKQDRLNFSFDPRKNLLAVLQLGSLHLATTNDTVYSSAGTPIFAAPKGGFTSDDIGTEFDASAKYIFHQSFVTNIGVGHFFPGAVMTSAHHGAPLTIAYLQFTYRFKVDK
ncbi:alginate export family protein [Granulicella sp. L46]|uniref:alginate export family protein n=1 Tax=Granulicella sp. L46 TaxID=1641865 RepID=UPI00131E1F92|nr:alginate export family protein [Granulicella sp. L46]